jgi:DNA-binding transcriptional MerR regulator
MTTGELSQTTGVPTSTLKVWVREGILRPAMAGYGRGDAHHFDEHNVAQVRAILAVREWFGDGRAARVVLASVRQVRQGTPQFTIESKFVVPLAS